MSEHVLGVDGLVKRFGKKTVVKDVSFEMRTGEVVGLLGPNGAGKTTIFYMVVGFLTPTEGRVYFDFHDISRLPMYNIARLGISSLSKTISI